MGIGAGLLLGSAFIAGFIAESIISHFGPDGIRQYSMVSEVQSLVDTFYLREQPQPIVREYGAIRGMLSTLGDKYTFFIEPQVAQSEADALAGTFGGVGLVVQLDQLGNFVVILYPNSPATNAGLANGDFLISINGIPVRQLLPIDNVDQLLRGEVRDGNGVEIEYQSRASGRINALFLPFEVIQVPSVVWNIIEEYPNIAYLRISLFTNRTPDELESALTELSENGIESIVLDLRDNSGGLLQEAVEVASYFLSDVPIAYEKTLTSERVIMAISASTNITLPMVVLVNSGSASAAELVAAALQDHERAILIGHTTYGKGSVQQIFRLSDGSSIHITTAEWLSPLGRQIAEIGVMPDIEVVEPSDTLGDQYLNAAINVLTSETSD